MQGLTACSVKLPRCLAASTFRHRIRRPLFFKLRQTAWSNSSTTTSNTEYSPELVIHFDQLQELRQSSVFFFFFPCYSISEFVPCLCILELRNLNDRTSQSRWMSPSRIRHLSMPFRLRLLSLPGCVLSPLKQYRDLDHRGEQVCALSLLS